MKVEICANSYQSAKAAQHGGAHRIELCSELEVGGVTPSHGLIAKVVCELSIPVHVLIRPRSGNFIYTAAELDVMLRDIEFCKSMGCAGVVTGALDDDGHVDMAFAERLIAASAPLHFTFHRAFDCVQEPVDTLEKLKQLGVQRILTSGLKPKAIEGLDLLKKLKAVAGDIEIMPGSGINAGNCITFKEEGFTSIHLSAIRKQEKEDFGESLFGKENLPTTDETLVREVVDLVS
ncbi:MAG: copper homeostasis protein CutC [Cytophagaceae bacterium]|nr:copper homeostasis protein CutC [Cytophagaceae bacterium]|tara:strand:- start:859 stop:1560 length:702 start_codon:yes stop_codon:yes gene_type:complete